jgi:hypothetical protein
MLPKSWEEYLATAEREIKRTPPEAPRAPGRIQRHMSSRMRTALRQTPNRIRAIYTEEAEPNRTPTKPLEWRGTRNVGGNCEPRTYYSTKSTQSRNPSK